MALTTAAAAAIGAGLAAASSGVLADHFLQQREDQRVLHAAETLAIELRATDGSDAAAQAVLADERAEMAHAGLHFAFYRGDRAIGGTDLLGPVSASGCVTKGAGRSGLRRCGVAVHGAFAVAGARLEPIVSLRAPFAIAALLAVVGAALGGALASHWIAAWAVGPLTRLSQAVATVSANSPADVDLGTAEGVREIDALREALRVLLERLDETLTQTRRFSAQAAHELRTPLTALRGEVELLLELSLERSVRSPLARVRRSLTAMSTLVERLLVLAGPRDPLEGTSVAVSLADVVTEAQQALEPGRRDRVVLHLNDEGLVRGDAALLRALVDNAIDNALKFSGNEPVEVTVTESAQRVSLRVTDRGPGIHPEERERVFDPFYRTPTARAHHEGHGLGLALIAHVARAHDGQATFDETSHGASLQVCLPCWPASG